jgi:hypothetical protein
MLTKKTAEGPDSLRQLLRNLVAFRRLDDMAAIFLTDYYTTNLALFT